MQFLAPLWLALAGAAAVPLLLHLLRRQTGTRVPFPAARFLARAEQEQSARVRLRNWLLLALRVLALALVALAAARPLVGVRAGARAPAALAVVLDNSLSTAAIANGRPVLDGLRIEALAALDRAGPRDRVWLVTADGRVTGADANVARAAARDARTLAGAGDLPAAVARAVALARAAGLGPGAVVVVTDGQVSAWTRPVRAGGVRVAVVAPGTPPPADRAVLDVAPAPARWSPVGEVVGQLSGAGPWRVALAAPGASTDAGAARGTADSAGAARVTLRPATRGWLAGALALPPDEWRASDVRHFAVLAADPPAATADLSAGPFITAALASLAASGRVRDPGTSASVRVAEPAAATRLPALLVAPADGARLGAANQALARLGVPWRFGALVAAAARARLHDVDGGSGPFGSDSAAPIDVARRWRLERTGATAPADTLADAAGEPWAVAGDGYVLLASPLDPAWTAFPLRAAFVPWLEAVLARRLTGGGRIARAAPGMPVRPPAGADALVGPYTPEAPADAGRSVATAAVVGAVGRPAPDRPGVYFWQRAGERVGALVVDPEPAELALARLSAAPLATRVQADAPRGARASADGAAAAATLLDGAGRRPVGGLLAAAALLALVAEAVAARPRAAGGVSGAGAAPAPRARAA